MSPSQPTGSFDRLERVEVFAGVERETFTTPEATVSRYTFAPGASFPIHHHAQEQITLVEEGSVSMTIAGQAHVLDSGEWSVVAPDVEHGITAGDDGARIVAVVVPARERPDEYELTGASGGGPR
jgi:quercetin dioxygenase-like cupin family protein